MIRILSVEDSPEEQLVLRSALHGYQVQFATSAVEAVKHLERGGWSLLVIDVSLPDGNGLDVLAHARKMEQYRHTPILVLTGRQEFRDKAAAFTLGADDYLVKPYDPRELKLRIDARLRQSQVSNEQLDLLELGDLVIDRNMQRVQKLTDGAIIDLTTLEFRILQFLARSPGRVFTRNSLIDAVWGAGIAITARTVDSHVSKIRRKLGQSRVQIETIFGTGYKLDVAAQGTPGSLQRPL